MGGQHERQVPHGEGQRAGLEHALAGDVGDEEAERNEDGEREEHPQLRPAPREGETHAGQRSRRMRTRPIMISSP